MKTVKFMGTYKIKNQILPLCIPIKESYLNNPVMAEKQLKGDDARLLEIHNLIPVGISVDSKVVCTTK